MRLERTCDMCGAGPLRPDSTDEDLLVCNSCGVRYEAQVVPNDEFLIGPPTWGHIRVARDADGQFDPNFRLVIENCWKLCEKFTPLGAFKYQLNAPGAWTKPGLDLYAPRQAYLRLLRHLDEAGYPRWLISFTELERDAIPFPADRN